MTLLVALLLPTMVSLGFWQLRRADENRGLLLLAQKRQQQPAMPISQLPLNRLLADITGGHTESWQYFPVRLHGAWLPESFLVENQLDNGRNGYHVVSVMQLDNDAHILVNRGWVPAPASRNALPQYPQATAGQEELGHIYVSAHILSDEPVYAESGWPRRVGRLQVPGFARELGYEVMPLVIRLQEGSPSALTTHWPVVNIAPEKNVAYAIQWFAMSAALLVCYLVFGYRRRDRPEESGDNVHG
jgi:surfeit locus 1 family protein